MFKREIKVGQIVYKKSCTDWNGRGGNNELFIITAETKQRLKGNCLIKQYNGEFIIGRESCIDPAKCVLIDQSGITIVQDVPV